MDSFKIGRLAKLSGFEPALLRAWERRHGLLQPVRLSNGFRLYTSEDLALLKHVRKLLDGGSSIGDIVRGGRDRLLERVKAQGAPRARRKEPKDLLGALEADVAWAALDAMPCAVVVTDKSGLVRWVNRGVPLLCGYDLGDFHGVTPGSVLQGPGTDLDAVAKLRAGITDKRACSVRILNYHKSGEAYTARVDVSPLGIGATHVGFVAAVRREESRGELGHGESREGAGRSRG